MRGFVGMQQLACMTTVLLFASVTQGINLTKRGSRKPFSWLKPDAHLRAELADLAVDNSLFVTQTSCAYLEFSQNWIHHVEALEIKSWIVVASDDVAYEWLHTQYPGHIYHVERFRNMLSENNTDSVPDTSAFASFGSAAFAQLTCVRPVILAGILVAGINSFWSDADSAYLSDPRHVVPNLYEYVGADDSHTGNEQNTTRLCTGFSFLRPTVSVSDLLLDWHHDCVQGLDMSSTRHDQTSFNAVMQAEGKRNSLKFYILPRRVAPNGDLCRQIRLDKDAKPLWIHANWVVGRKAKQSLLREKKVWYFSSVLPKC